MCFTHCYVGPVVSCPLTRSRERDNIGAHVRRSEIALPAAGFIFLRLIMGAAHLSGNADHLALKAFVVRPPLAPHLYPCAVLCGWCCVCNVELHCVQEAKGKLTKIPSNLPLWASTMGHLGVAAYVRQPCDAFVAVTCDVGCSFTRGCSHRYYCNQFEIAARCFGLAMHNRIEVCFAGATVACGSVSHHSEWPLWVLQNVGESHCDTLAAQHNLGCALVMAGEGSEAIVALSKASSGLNSSVGPTHVRAAVATRNLMKARRHAANL